VARVQRAMVGTSAIVLAGAAPGCDLRPQRRTVPHDWN
jgi:hypothetical protein